MNEHFKRIPKEDRPIAEKMLNKKRVGYFFNEDKLILMDCIPTDLKEEEEET